VGPVMSSRPVRHGYVVNWQVREGTMLAPNRVAAAGTFVDTSSIDVIAAFPQSFLTNVRPGNEVELLLDSHLGVVFKGRVDAVIPASGAANRQRAERSPAPRRRIRAAYSQ